MQSHRDYDAAQHRVIQEKFLKELKAKADRIVAEGGSQITAGKPGERIIEEFEHEGICVRKLPDDEHAILRISIGGGDHLPVNANYCIFRGDRAACLTLLRRAVAALE